MMPLFASYFRERVRFRLFGPVVLLLTLTACWAANTFRSGDVLRAASLMALLVVFFRLWDDLADRARDRVAHPDRVLGRTDARPFVGLAVALAIAGLIAAGWIGGMKTLFAVAGLGVGFAGLYGWVRKYLNAAVWRYPVLLAKYPAFVVIVASAVGAPSPERSATAALLTYAAANAYEALHSRRRSPS